MKIIDFRLRPPFGDYVGSYFFTKKALDNYHKLNRMPLSPSALEQSMTKCLEEMDACGIIKGMAHANLDMNVNNESIAKLVETHPDRFIGCIDMDIYDMERALRDIDEYILDGPCSCVNLETAWLHNSKPIPFNDHRLYPILEKCQKHDIIVNYVTGFGSDKLENLSPYILDEVAYDFPDLRIVVGHGGWPFIREYCWIAHIRKNVWISPDQYMFNSPGFQDFVTAANNLLKGKMIYGSCYPLVALDAAIDYTKALGLSEDAYYEYMYGAAARLFGFEEAE